MGALRTPAAVVQVAVESLTPAVCPLSWLVRARMRSDSNTAINASIPKTSFPSDRADRGPDPTLLAGAPDLQARLRLSLKDPILVFGYRIKPVSDEVCLGWSS